MQSLLDAQRAFYWPREGPPMLLYHEPNPLRRRKRKRRKLAKKHVPIPHRTKEVLPSNFPASQLPEGFPPDLAFRALAAYSLLRTLSCELRLSPFTPNVFLRALYLPLPSKLIGQVHASLLRILLASLNMGYSCKPKGNNIPDVIRKKRRVDGIRWPLRGGDNLTFLDNFSWPLFYDDYVHLTADILWATMNSQENHGDFRTIGMPDLTGMILEEDLREQEEDKSLMAKPAKISHTLAANENSPYPLDVLNRSSRSARRAKVSYSHVESDDDSYEEEAVEEEAIAKEEEEEYIDRRKGSSKKRGRPIKQSLPNSGAAQLPTQKQKPSSFVHASIHARGDSSATCLKGANGSSLEQNQSMQASKGKAVLSTTKAKKIKRMLPSIRSKKKSSLSQQPDAISKRRSPGTGRKLPTQGSKGSSPSPKKARRSPFSGSKVEWVEEGPSPSHFQGNRKSNDAKCIESPLPKSAIATPPKPNASPSKSSAVPGTALEATFPGGIQPNGTQQVPAIPAMSGLTVGVPHVSGVSASPYVAQQVIEGNADIAQQYNATLLAQACLVQQMQATETRFYSPFPSPPHNHMSAPMFNPSPNLQHPATTDLLNTAAKAGSTSGHRVPKEMGLVLRDYIAGRLSKEAQNASAELTRDVVEAKSGAMNKFHHSQPALREEGCPIQSGTEVIGQTGKETIINRAAKSNHKGGLEAGGDLGCVAPKVQINCEENGEKRKSSIPVEVLGIDRPCSPSLNLIRPPALQQVMPSAGDPSTALASTGNCHDQSNLGTIFHAKSISDMELVSSTLSSSPLSAASLIVGIDKPEITTAKNNANNGGEINVNLNGHQRESKTGEKGASSNLVALRAPSSGLLCGAHGTESGHDCLAHAEVLGKEVISKSKLGCTTLDDVGFKGGLAPLAQTKLKTRITNPFCAISTASLSPKAETEGLIYSQDKTSAKGPGSLLESVKDYSRLSKPASFSKQERMDQQSISADQKGPIFKGRLDQCTEWDSQLCQPSGGSSPPQAGIVQSQREGLNMKVDALDDDHTVASEDSAALPFADDKEQWPQFQPIRSMRAGLPYHRLSLEEKLVVLEFLIDELLAMGTFASVFTQRNVTNMYNSTYAALPCSAEFDELENEDECAVCKGEGELLCCDGCVSSYHRSCIDMRQNEVLPEGRWLCPECVLVDPARHGSLRGGRKSSLDWFTVEDIKSAICVKNGSNQNGLEETPVMDGTTLAMSTPTTQKPGSPPFSQPATGLAGIMANSSMHLVAPKEKAKLSAVGTGTQGGNNSTMMASAAGVLWTGTSTNSLGTPAAETSMIMVNGCGAAKSHASIQEFLVVHGFMFARSPHTKEQTEKQPHNNAVDPSLLEPLSKTQLCQVLKSVGPETSLAWPLAQIPFTTLDERFPVPRSAVHPKVLAFDVKSSFDPTGYISKYRKTPLAKSAFPGANFHLIQLLLSDYEYVCNTCNLKRLSDRLSPDMSTDRLLAQSLRAEANLFDPYQLMRDYMLKLENLLNRAHLLNEFWGTRNKDIKAHVWQMNVRNCRSIPRLARLLLMLIDACHRRAFTEQWFVFSGSKQEDQPIEEGPTTDSKTLQPLPLDWTLAAEKRKRKWERSSLANVLSLLAKEGRDVKQWVYGEGKGALGRKKRKQAVTGRSPYLPGRTLVSSKDSKKFVVDDVSIGVVSLSKRDIVGVVDNEKKKPMELDSPGFLSIQVLQQAIDHRVTTGIPNGRAKGGVAVSQAESAEKMSSSSAVTSRRSRRSGRLQTKKESPEDFIANVIAESGKAQKDLSIATLIEAQEMSKLVEIKELSAIPFGGTGHWPVAGRLLFDPAGSLCRAEMKRLGRNAGIAMAQHVNYVGSYEVGVVSHFHVWRKNMQKCFSYEQLLLLIRALESNLDKPTITSCEALARRTPHARSQVSKVVKCTQKDAMVGVDHHFILQKNKNRGSWISSLTLELSPFMVERSERREKEQEAFSKKLREKSMEEARAREAARLKAAAEAAAHTQALMREQAAARAKAAREQAEAKAKVLKEKAEAKAAAKAAKAAQKAKEKAEKAATKAKLKAERDAAREASKQTARAKLMQPQSAMSQQTQNTVDTQNDVKRILMAHKMATQQLIREASNAGLSFVPESEIKRLRMKAAANLQNCYRGVQINSDTLFSQLGKAESDALKAETQAKKAAVDRRLQNTVGGMQMANKETAQTWSLSKQSKPGSSEQATNHRDLPGQPMPVGVPMYRPSGTTANMHAKTAAVNRNMQQGATGQHAGNSILSSQLSNHSQSHAGPASTFSVGQTQASKQGKHATGPTQSGQCQWQGNAYNPSPSGFFTSQSHCAGTSQGTFSSRAMGNAPSSIGGYNPFGAPQKPQLQQSDPRTGIDWGCNPQLQLPNHLLHTLDGDAGKQQGMQGVNHQLGSGIGNSWNQVRGRDRPRETQLSELARLANGSADVQQIMHGRSGAIVSSHQQSASSLRAPRSESHFQDMVCRTDCNSTGIPPASNCLPNAMGSFPRGQFYQTTTGGRPAFPGHNNLNSVFGGSSSLRQVDPGRDERRMSAQPQQTFDFEPTPIAELARGTPQQAPPPNNAYSPNGHPHQHQQHQWFQR